MAIAEIERKSPFDSPYSADLGVRNVRVELIVMAVVGLAGFAVRTQIEEEGLQNIAFLVLGLTGVAMVIHRTLYGIVAMVFAIGLTPDTFIASGLRIEDFLLPPLVLIWLVRKGGNGEPFVQTTAYKDIKIYVAVITFATIKGLYMGYISNTFVVSAFYFKYIEYFVLFWFMVNNVKEKEDVMTILIASMFACAMVAMIAYSRRAIKQSELDMGFVRAAGPEGETPNILGGYFMMHVMLALAFFFMIKKSTYKIILLAFMIGVAIPLLFTYSRTSLVSLLFGLLITVIFVDFRYLLILLLLVVLSPILIPMEAVPKDLVDRYQTILALVNLDEEETAKPVSSWEARQSGWYVYYLYTKKDDPIFGRGVGSVGLGVDSAYAKKFFESGVIGLLAFLMMLARLGRIAVDLIKKTNDDIYKSYAIGYLGLLAGMCVHGIGVSSFSTIRTAEPFWLFSGVLIAVAEIVRREADIAEEEETDKDELEFVPKRYVFGNWSPVT
ncbi:MAG: hypothetical protein HQL31_00440 [Planctomycetes bacterium]|nr:hypothetical protein [Planctomycetota bacterium]